MNRHKNLFTAAVYLFVGSIASSAMASYTLGPTTPGKWGDPTPGTPATITYSFMATGVDLTADGGGLNVALADFMPAGYEAEIVKAFDAWSAIAGVTFVEVPDGGEAFNAAGTSGDIRIGGHTFDGVGGVLGHGFFPPDNGFTAAGDIHFDVDEAWKIGFGGAGTDIAQEAARQIGYAIGLGNDSDPANLVTPAYTEAFFGPQAGDIDGAQYLYGPALAVPAPAALPAGLMAIGAMAMRRRRVG